MGVVKKVVNSISKIFGGGDTPEIEVQTPAPAAAPEGEGAQMEEQVNNTTQKRRRGKRDLIVDTNSSTPTRNTGLNI